MSQPQPSAITSLQKMFRLAVEHAQPEHTLPKHLPTPPTKGRTTVIGAGKASAVMAQTLEQHWAGPLTGLVVTGWGDGADCHHVAIIEAAPPIPDQNSLLAAQRITELAKQATAEDLVIVLRSGGGSSLLCAPAEGLDLNSKQRIHEALLHSGASISEINCVRRHLSRIKIGRAH